MKTIETTATVAPDGTLTARVLRDVPHGEYHIVLVIDEKPAEGQEVLPFDFPVDDLVPWPEGLSLRREDI